MTDTRLPHIGVVIAAFNRRELTRRALRSLKAQEGLFQLSLFLFDDGSTDGTADAVRAEWPDATILTGDGTAFWNRGMHLAWAKAAICGLDGYLWLNDDVALDPDALSKLAREWHAQGAGKSAFVLVGPTRGEKGELTYSGMRRVRSPFGLRFDRLPLVESVTPADTFNGNIVLLSHATVERVGLNDPSFLQQLGDIDYGLRASRAGVPILVLPGTLGVCAQNQPITYDQRSLRERWKAINSFRGFPVRNWWRMTRRHSGIWFPLHFVLPYRKLFKPSKASHRPSGSNLPS